MKFKIVDKVIFIAMCAVIALMGFVLTADAQQFIVRTIYFQPTDAPGPTRQIFQLLTETQEFYRDEMHRHGYEAKTFRHETDGKGNIGIHLIKGRHKMDHYLDDTYNRVKSELPFKYFTAEAQDNILVIIVGGIKQLSTGKRAWGGYFMGKKAGGIAIISGEVLTFKLMAHEMGHTFALNHANSPDAIMWNGSDILLDYESRWLDRHHFFNDKHIRNGEPQFIKSLPIEAIENDKVRFKVVAKSRSDLYHAQLYRKRESLVIGWAEIEGESATIEVDVSRGLLRDGNHVSIQIMDVHGNKSLSSIGNITLPEPLPEKPEKLQVIVENEDILVDCPGCNPLDDETGLAVHPRWRLTTQWALLKQR